MRWRTGGGFARNLWTLVILSALVIDKTSAAPVIDGDEEGQTQLQESDTGCYYNLQKYDEGDRIITNEPCLNCTCHNRMLMCYLRVCPFTKPIGPDCTVEKRADQCCPIINCPEVPVQLLTSTTENNHQSAIEEGQQHTAVGHLDDHGCNIDNEFYTDGAQLPTDFSNPCELCYCIRNKTVCLMQECTLQVVNCKPIYTEGVCCPIRYACDDAEESNATTTTTTEAPTTPGLIMTSPSGGPLDCKHNGSTYADGSSIETEAACEHCYCMRGEIVCVVNDCGAAMENQNCKPEPPKSGSCCPETYHCDNNIDADVNSPNRQDRKHKADNVTTEEEAATTESEVQAVVSEIYPRPEKPLHVNEIPTDDNKEHTPVTDETLTGEHEGEQKVQKPLETSTLKVQQAEEGTTLTDSQHLLSEAHVTGEGSSTTPEVGNKINVPQESSTDVIGTIETTTFHYSGTSTEESQANITPETEENVTKYSSVNSESDGKPTEPEPSSNQGYEEGTTEKITNVDVEQASGEGTLVLSSTEGSHPSVDAGETSTEPGAPSSSESSESEAEGSISEESVTEKTSTEKAITNSEQGTSNDSEHNEVSATGVTGLPEGQEIVTELVSTEPYPVSEDQASTEPSLSNENSYETPSGTSTSESSHGGEHNTEATNPEILSGGTTFEQTSTEQGLLHTSSHEMEPSSVQTTESAHEQELMTAVGNTEKTPVKGEMPLEHGSTEENLPNSSSHEEEPSSVTEVSNAEKGDTSEQSSTDQSAPSSHEEEPSGVYTTGPTQELEPVTDVSSTEKEEIMFEHASTEQIPPENSNEEESSATDATEVTQGQEPIEEDNISTEKDIGTESGSTEPSKSSNGMDTLEQSVVSGAAQGSSDASITSEENITEQSVTEVSSSEGYVESHTHTEHKLSTSAAGSESAVPVNKLPTDKPVSESSTEGGIPSENAETEGIGTEQGTEITFPGHDDAVVETSGLTTEANEVEQAHASEMGSEGSAVTESVHLSGSSATDITHTEHVDVGTTEKIKPSINEENNQQVISEEHSATESYGNDQGSLNELITEQGMNLEGSGTTNKELSSTEPTQGIITEQEHESGLHPPETSTVKDESHGLSSDHELSSTERNTAEVLPTTESELNAPEHNNETGNEDNENGHSSTNSGVEVSTEKEEGQNESASNQGGAIGNYDNGLSSTERPTVVNTGLGAEDESYGTEEMTTEPSSISPGSVSGSEKSPLPASPDNELTTEQPNKQPDRFVTTVSIINENPTSPSSQAEIEKEDVSQTPESHLGENEASSPVPVTESHEQSHGTVVEDDTHHETTPKNEEETVMVTEGLAYPPSSLESDSHHMDEHSTVSTLLSHGETTENVPQKPLDVHQDETGSTPEEGQSVVPPEDSASSPEANEIDEHIPKPTEATVGMSVESDDNQKSNGSSSIESNTENAEHVTLSGLIPGEGSCYVDKLTYANNSDIPPASPCQISCRCVSSIVHCILVSCPPAPEDQRCSPTIREGTCCPTYTCTSTRPGYEQSTERTEEEIPSTEKSSPAAVEIITEQAPEPSLNEVAHSTTLEPAHSELPLETSPSTEMSMDNEVSHTSTAAESEHEAEQSSSEQTKHPEINVADTEVTTVSDIKESSTAEPDKPSELDSHQSNIDEFGTTGTTTAISEGSILSTESSLHLPVSQGSSTSGPDAISTEKNYAVTEVETASESYHTSDHEASPGLSTERTVTIVEPSSTEQSVKVEESTSSTETVTESNAGGPGNLSNTEPSHTSDSHHEDESTENNIASSEQTQETELGTHVTPKPVINPHEDESISGTETPIEQEGAQPEQTNAVTEPTTVNEQDSSTKGYVTPADAGANTHEYEIPNQSTEGPKFHPESSTELHLESLSTEPVPPESDHSSEANNQGVSELSNTNESSITDSETATEHGTSSEVSLGETTTAKSITSAGEKEASSTSSTTAEATLDESEPSSTGSSIEDLDQTTDSHQTGGDITSNEIENDNIPEQFTETISHVPQEGMVDNTPSGHESSESTTKSTHDINSVLGTLPSSETEADVTVSPVISSDASHTSTNAPLSSESHQATIGEGTVEGGSASEITPTTTKTSVVDIENRPDGIKLPGTLIDSSTEPVVSSTTTVPHGLETSSNPNESHSEGGAATISSDEFPTEESPLDYQTSAPVNFQQSTESTMESTTPSKAFDSPIKSDSSLATDSQGASVTERPLSSEASPESPGAQASSESAESLGSLTTEEPVSSEASSEAQATVGSAEPEGASVTVEPVSSETSPESPGLEASSGSADSQITSVTDEPASSETSPESPGTQNTSESVETEGGSVTKEPQSPESPGSEASSDSAESQGPLATEEPASTETSPESPGAEASSESVEPEGASVTEEAVSSETSPKSPGAEVTSETVESEGGSVTEEPVSSETSPVNPGFEASSESAESQGPLATEEPASTETSPESPGAQTTSESVKPEGGSVTEEPVSSETSPEIPESEVSSESTESQGPLATEEPAISETSPKSPEAQVTSESVEPEGASASEEPISSETSSESPTSEPASEDSEHQGAAASEEPLATETSPEHIGAEATSAATEPQGAAVTDEPVSSETSPETPSSGPASEGPEYQGVSVSEEPVPTETSPEHIGAEGSSEGTEPQGASVTEEAASSETAPESPPSDAITEGASVSEEPVPTETSPEHIGAEGSSEGTEPQGASVTEEAASSETAPESPPSDAITEGASVSEEPVPTETSPEHVAAEGSSEGTEPEGASVTEEPASSETSPESLPSETVSEGASASEEPLPTETSPEHVAAEGSSEGTEPEGASVTEEPASSETSPESLPSETVSEGASASEEPLPTETSPEHVAAEGSSEGTEPQGASVTEEPASSETSPESLPSETVSEGASASEEPLPTETSPEHVAAEGSSEGTEPQGVSVTEEPANSETSPESPPSETASEGASVSEEPLPTETSPEHVGAEASSEGTDSSTDHKIPLGGEVESQSSTTSIGTHTNPSTESQENAGQEYLEVTTESHSALLTTTVSVSSSPHSEVTTEKEPAAVGSTSTSSVPLISTTEKFPERVDIPSESPEVSKPEDGYDYQKPVRPLAEKPQKPLKPQKPIEPEDAVEQNEYDDDYDSENETPYGPGTCRYAGKVYVSAQQIPRDDPCDFCFCFRSDIICLQQSCPPPIPGCHEEPISGFCCPRYECHVRMATVLNSTSTTTTTTTTLPPHFMAHHYRGAAHKTGCMVQGKAYRVGEPINSASGPCMDCICGGDGRMKCEPKVCSPEPMIRKMLKNNR